MHECLVAYNIAYVILYNIMCFAKPLHTAAEKPAARRWAMTWQEDGFHPHLSIVTFYIKSEMMLSSDVTDE